VPDNHGLQVTPELLVLGMEIASCPHCGTYNLEVAPRFMENLWTYLPLFLMQTFLVMTEGSQNI
jgi:hypothetical protein